MLPNWHPQLCSCFSMPVLHEVLHENGLFSNGNPITLPSYRLFIPWRAKTPIQISELLLTNFCLAALAFLLSLPTPPIPNLFLPQGLCICFSSTPRLSQVFFCTTWGLPCIFHILFTSFRCLLSYHKWPVLTIFAKIAVLLSTLLLCCITWHCFSSSCLSKFVHCL